MVAACAVHVLPLCVQPSALPRACRVPAAGLDVMGTWGPGGPAEGQLEAARAAALDALQRCVTDKDDARKAAAKVRRCLLALLLRRRRRVAHRRIQQQ